jgi:hypothetical protein
LFFHFLDLFFGYSLVCSQYRFLIIPYSSHRGSSYIHISCERGALGKHDEVCFYFGGGKHIYVFYVGVVLSSWNVPNGSFFFLND